MSSLLFIISMLFLVSWHRLRPRSEHADRQHEHHQRHRQDLQRARRPDLPHAPHRPVHHLPQLLEHVDASRPPPGSRMPWDSANIGALPLLIGFILLVFVIDIIMPGVTSEVGDHRARSSSRSSTTSGVAPQTVIAAYRVGDGPVNVITPLMVYLPFIILVLPAVPEVCGDGHGRVDDDAVHRRRARRRGRSSSSSGTSAASRGAPAHPSTSDARVVPWMTLTSPWSSSAPSSSSSSGTGCPSASSPSSRCSHCGPPGCFPSTRSSRASATPSSSSSRRSSSSARASTRPGSPPGWASSSSPRPVRAGLGSCWPSACCAPSSPPSSP